LKIEGQKKGCWFITDTQKMVIPMLALKTLKAANKRNNTEMIQI